MNIKNNKNIINKLKGSIYGFCIGDAIGACTEFMTPIQIKEHFGYVDKMFSGGYLGFEAGEVTDDSDLMLIVGNACLDNNNTSDILNEIKEEFEIWLDSNPKDCGNAIRKSIQSNRQKSYIEQIDNAADNTRLGNGSLMRCLIPCLMGRLDLAINQGKLTHNNKLCNNCIKLYYTQAVNILKYNKIINYKVDECEPSGKVDITLVNVIYTLENFNDFKSGIEYIVNRGGDSDTIAALYGGLAGLLYGYDDIPKEWVNQLNKKNIRKIEKILKKLFTFLDI